MTNEELLKLISDEYREARRNGLDSEDSYHMAIGEAWERVKAEWIGVEENDDRKDL